MKETKWELYQLTFLARLYTQQITNDEFRSAEKTKDRYFGLMDKIRERNKK